MMRFQHFTPRLARRSRMAAGAVCTTIGASLLVDVGARMHSKAASALGLVGDKSQLTSSPLNPFTVEPGCLLPGLPATEFQRRREQLFAVLPPKTALIVNAAETKFMSHDIPFEFRQNANFLYLTGVEEPDAHAVLRKAADGSCAFVLFTRPRDAHSEQWDGARLGRDGAIAKYFADDAYALPELAPALSKLLSGLDQIFVVAPDGGKYAPTFLDATRPFHDKFFAGSALVEQLRVVKSPAEIERMRFAADVGVAGFDAMMRHTKGGMTELALASHFEATIKQRGALYNSFPNVVGAGANAAIIHYLAKRDVLRPHELVLVDSGCEVAGGYVSDITRTWPVGGGPLLPAARDLYEFVLDVQKQSLAHLQRQLAAKKSISLDQLHDYSVQLMVDGLQQLRILSAPPAAGRSRNALLTEFQRYNPTHIGHYLGMDVHDTPHIPRSVPLQPGMVITVEPGIYVPQHDANVPHEFRGIGIRIEDDVVITDSGIDVLTKALPKELEEMEALRLA